MDRNGRYGESKWASLQAAEKTLKAAIALQGKTFKQTHDLQDLATDLTAAGVARGPPTLPDHSMHSEHSLWTGGVRIAIRRLQPTMPRSSS